jgi:hypothetical protein
MNEDRNKILRKIQKCLNLSKSSNPNEAAQALKQAKILMEKHNILPNNVDTVAGNKINAYNAQTLPDYLNYLLKVIQRTFNTVPLFQQSYNGSGYQLKIIFYGSQADIIISEYAWIYLSRLLTNTRNEFIKEKLNRCFKSNKTKKANEFAYGWVLGISSSLKELQITPDDEKHYSKVMDIRAVIESLNKLETIKQRKSRTELKINQEVMCGFKSGKNVKINKGIITEPKEIALCEQDLS